MYILQFCNAYTQEVLREVEYKSIEKVYSILNCFQDEHNQFCYLLDSRQRLLKANFVSNIVIYQGKDTVYRIFFKVKLNIEQPLVKN
ncbi:hypothetical protein ACIFOT_29980 [Neobacillus sp. NRS-1170]|uniref:hypothetical protein n=1 Tax=Neobacillus sp. NRS-1170 TaxID=3233898 RepID=UPI003D2B7D77